jgi:hypothetical protein
MDFTNGFHGFESNANIEIEEVQETIDPLHDQDLMQLKGYVESIGKSKY